MADWRAYPDNSFTGFGLALRTQQQGNNMNSMNSAALADDNLVTNTPASAISWAAIIAGAFTATVVSLALLIFGSGLGLATMSPWSAGYSATGFTLMTAIWLIVMQWIASAFGGYITGRLRTRWLTLHTDEVFFRDTAHGFLTWVLSTLFAAIFLTSVMSAAVKGGTHAAAMATSSAAASNAAASGTGETTGGNDPLSYYVDGLYRTTNPPAVNDRDVRAETMRIFAMGIKNGEFSEPDKAYLTQVVMARTGINEADARTRVNNAIAKVDADKEKVKVAADKARKAGAMFSISTALSMLIGAFVACVAAALGGKRRDQY